MTTFFEIMLVPFLACLVLTGIHAYLGLHVVERQVIFVDLALAQIAVLGASLGILFGYDVHSPQSYWLSLGFTVAGAAVFSLTRFRKPVVPHEAVIGIIYVVSSALMFIVLGFTGEGMEHIRQAFIGDILLISPRELIKITLIYTAIGLIHYAWRDRFYLISLNPEQAFEEGCNVRLWDFVFYVTFGIVVTCSVAVAGVLLVFSYLVIPAVAAMILSRQMKTRLFLGWAIGALGSVTGMAASYVFDLPSGSSVVCALFVVLCLAGLFKFTSK